MTQESNDAARDLWSQMFERAARHPGAAMVDPDYDPEEDEAKVRACYAAAGWSEKEIEILRGAGAEREKAAPSTSPGVNPAADAFHAALCDDIEAEMARQGIKSHEQVARGIEPRTGPFASKVGVIMTDQSIVTVGAFTYRFCGLVAKAFHRTTMLDAPFWQADDYSEAKARLLLRANMPAALYWHRIMMSFAMSGTHATVPFQPANRIELPLVEQVARAMELFIVGHEYGHHHLGHGRDIGADPRAEEFAADQFALRLCEPIGKRDRRPTWNPYLASGAGGAIILKALEMVRLFERALGGKLPAGDTHPSADERIARFDSVAAILPHEFVVLKGFRMVSVRVMDAVAGLMADFIEVMPDDARARLVEMRREIWNELPRD